MFCGCGLDDSTKMLPAQHLALDPKPRLDLVRGPDSGKVRLRLNCVAADEWVVLVRGVFCLWQTKAPVVVVVVAAVAVAVVVVVIILVVVVVVVVITIVEVVVVVGVVVVVVVRVVVVVALALLLVAVLQPVRGTRYGDHTVWGGPSTCNTEAYIYIQRNIHTYLHIYAFTRISTCSRAHLYLCSYMWYGMCTSVISIHWSPGMR